MLTSGYNSKKLPKGFQGYPKLKWIFGFFGVTCNYNLLSNFLVQRLLKLSDLRIFGFVQKLDNFTVWLKFKDFWIFPLNNFFSPEIITSYRIKDFWIFSKKNPWSSQVFFELYPEVSIIYSRCSPRGEIQKNYPKDFKDIQKGNGF